MTSREWIVLLVIVVGLPAGIWLQWWVTKKTDPWIDRQLAKRGRKRG